MIAKPPVQRQADTVAKRGQGTPGLTTTPDVWPTAPPTTTYRHRVPTIKGSEGGFIGLVAGLGALILVCSLGVWFLLKRRKQYGGGSNARGIPMPFGFGQKQSGGNTAAGTNMFGRGKRGKGWLRTGDGEDEDDQDSNPLTQVRARSRSPNPPPRGSDDHYADHPYGNPRAQGGEPGFSSASTVKLSAPGPYGDAFSPSASRDDLDSPPHARGGRSGAFSPTSPDSGHSRFQEHL